MGYTIVDEILGTECIGNSLTKINTNFSDLDTHVVNLSSSFNVNNVSSLTTNSTLVSALSVFDGPTYLGYIPLYK